MKGTYGHNYAVEIITGNSASYGDYPVHTSDIPDAYYVLVPLPLLGEVVSGCERMPSLAGSLSHTNPRVISHISLDYRTGISVRGVNLIYKTISIITYKP